MLQQQTIIFWGKGDREDFEKTFSGFSDIFSALKNNNNFIDSIQVKDGSSYKDYENVDLRRTIEKGVNREGNKAFPELGYRVEFRFDLFGTKTYGSALLGCSSIKCYNTLRIVIPYTIDLSVPSNGEQIIKLFAQLSLTYSWFWGAVIDNISLKRIGKLYENGIPTAIHWINYFDEMDSALNEGGILSDNEYTSIISPGKNIVALDTIPFDATDERGIAKREAIYSKMFGK